MGTLSSLRDIIRGAIGTYVVADKLDAIRKALAVPDIGDLHSQLNGILVRLAEQESRSVAAAQETSRLLAEQGSLIAEQNSRSAAAAQEAIRLLRGEYTVMPRFAYHQPTDYLMDSEPPQFEPVIHVPGVALPLPSLPDRYGYAVEDAEYLAWGSYDADIIRAQITRYLKPAQPLAIMDFGCATGRVLRHFHSEHLTHGWQLYGVDIQARCIEWLRRHFPAEFTVYTGTVLPTLPFADNSLDVIYGMSVFTHTKYLWDTWLLELRRVLRPGGLLIQSIHTEHAWNFYYRHRQEGWVRDNHSPRVYDMPTMDLDWFHYGDISVSQTFWKREIAREFWGRYIDVLDILPPPDKYSFQDWVVCRKPGGPDVEPK